MSSREASRPVELGLVLDRDAAETLGGQVEGQIRRAIREGELRAGTRVPSTRDLARQLSVSRRVAVEAYSQLAAEGYLVLRQGAQARVADGMARASASGAKSSLAGPAPVARLD